jgi:purine-binding chemotaxis protein CheW
MNLQGEKSQKTFRAEAEKYMEFSLGGECYAIPLLRVKEVIAPTNCTPIPNSPPYMLGLINLRGQVLSVFDLRKKLNVKPRENTEEEAVIIIDLNPMYFGVKVDSINTVLALGSEEVSEVPEAMATKSNYMSGIYRAANKLVILMDIEKVLGSDILQTQKAA